MEMDTEEELNYRVNGGDLDDDSDNERDFDKTMRELELERSHGLSGDGGIEQTDEGDMNSM